MGLAANSARGIGSAGVQVGVASNIAMAGEKLGVGQDVSSAVSSLADMIPGILDVAGGFQTDAMLLSAERMAGGDLETLVNVNSFLLLAGVIYVIGKAMGGEEGRLSAFGGSVIWTTIAATLFNESFNIITQNSELFARIGELTQGLPNNGVGDFLANRDNLSGVLGIASTIASSLTIPKVWKNLKGVIKGRETEESGS